MVEEEESGPCSGITRNGVCPDGKIQEKSHILKISSNSSKALFHSTAIGGSYRGLESRTRWTSSPRGRIVKVRTMGNNTGKTKLASEIKELIASQGTKIKSHATVAFVTAVAEASPWFITGDGLNIPDWEQVKVDLQKILRKKGTDNMPLVTFSIWHLVKDALLTDKVKVKEQLVEEEQSLEKIQEEEVRKSVSASDTQSEDKEESQFETKAQEVKVKEFSFSSSSESDSEEEERLEQEIVDLKRKLKKYAERPMWLPEHCVCPVDVPADTKDHEDDPDSTNIGTGAMDVGKESPSTNSSRYS
ncbi:hypothetical protein STEG23_028626 [Scotinomys teguina]